MKTFITAGFVALTFASPVLAEGGGGGGLPNGFGATSNAQSQSGSQSSINTTNGGDSVNSVAVVAPSSNNTAPCVMAPSFGVGGGGIGFGAAIPYVNRDCVTRVEAQILTEISQMRGQQRSVAIMHFCTNTETMRRTMVAMNWCALASK